MDGGRLRRAVGWNPLRVMHPEVEVARIMPGDYWQLRPSVIGGRGPVIVCDAETIAGCPSELWVSGESGPPGKSLIGQGFPVIVLETMKLWWISLYDIEPLSVSRIPGASRPLSLQKAYEIAAKKRDLKSIKEKMVKSRGLKSLSEEITTSEDEDARKAIEGALDEIVKEALEELDSRSGGVEPQRVTELPDGFLPKVDGKHLAHHQDKSPEPSRVRKRKGEGALSEGEPAKSVKIESLSAELQMVEEPSPMKQIAKDNPEPSDFVTILVGEQLKEFIIERGILKKSPVLESSIIDGDGLGPHILRMFLLRSNVSDFEAVKEFLQESEYAPRLRYRGTDAPYFGDAMTGQQRADEGSRCGRIYCLALKLALPGLQQLAIQKLKAIHFFSGCGILQLAKYVYSNTTDPGDPLRLFLVRNIAENIADLPAIELETAISGCAQLSHDLVMYMAHQGRKLC